MVGATIRLSPPDENFQTPITPSVPTPATARLVSATERDRMGLVTRLLVAWLQAAKGISRSGFADIQSQNSMTPL
jgi:hypothetical protein